MLHHLSRSFDLSGVSLPNSRKRRCLRTLPRYSLIERRGCSIRATSRFLGHLFPPARVPCQLPLRKIDQSFFSFLALGLILGLD